jgi:predicted 3-demethylubiquinone-9 3-methyltransferase (glyoxalase superfamily)
MARIVPHLWFDKEAKEAAAFYTSLFGNSRVTATTRLVDTPSGDCDLVSFELRRQPFMAISAGPLFKFNPSISFFVNYDPSRGSGARERLDATWEQMAEGGTVLMPLQEYPFSKRYGWIQDRYGLSWQLILTDPQGEERPGIVPCLLFVGQRYGQAEATIQHYLSVFRGSPMGPEQESTRLGTLVRYPAGSAPDREGNVMFADFQLLDTWLAAMESAHEHSFGFNEAVSLVVLCDTQEQLDHSWSGLSAVPEAAQCGWLKDRFGVSWQVVPSALHRMMASGDQEAVSRITQAFLPMKKLDVGVLEGAFRGR